MIGKLLRLLLAGWPGVLLAAVCGALTVLANTALLATSAYLISLAALQPPLSALAVSIAAVRFFGIARAGLRYAERLTAHAVSLRLLARLQVWFYQEAEPRVPMGLAQYRSTELWQRLVNDIEIIKFLYVRLLHPPFVALLVLIAAIGFAACFSLVLAAILASGFLIAGVLIPWLSALCSRRLAEAAAVRQEEVNLALTDTLEGMAELAACGLTQEWLTARQQQGAGLDTLKARIASGQAFFDALTAITVNASVAAALWQSCLLVEQRQLDGVFLAVIPLAVQGFFETVWPMAALGRSYSEIRESAGRLAEIFGKEREPAGEERDGAVLPEQNVDIQLENIHFSYPGASQPALDGVSLYLPPGRRLAVVGPSGAGKSTLLFLLLRFAEQQAGSIRFSGVDSRDCRAEEVRRLFGVVSQDAYFFHASLRDNLRLARPDAGEDELWQVLRQAYLTELVASLPDGLDTILGRNGYLLSGGERQRLALARALLTNAPVLLLDEPASGLDAEAERQVMAALQQLPGDKSVLLITHRLTGLEAMDEIVVFDKGRIRQRGTFQQLLTEDGLFARMYERQNIK